MFNPTRLTYTENIHEFHSLSPRYFPPDDCNYPTRLLGKLLVVAFLRYEMVSLPFYGTEMYLDILAGSLPDRLGDSLTYNQMLNLLSHLYVWAEENGLPVHLKVPGQTERCSRTGQLTFQGSREHRSVAAILHNSGWWDWVHPHIDWQWIARRIQKEVLDHSHRARERADELERGLPYKQIRRILRTKGP